MSEASYRVARKSSASLAAASCSADPRRMMYPSVPVAGFISATSKLSMRPSCCMRPYRPMASLKTSRPRSSRPCTLAPQVIIRTRSAMCFPLLAARGTAPEPDGPTLPGRAHPRKAPRAVWRLRVLRGLGRQGTEDERLDRDVRFDVVRAHEGVHLAPGQILDGGDELLAHRLLVQQAGSQHRVLQPVVDEALLPARQQVAK